MSKQTTPTVPQTTGSEVTPATTTPAATGSKTKRKRTPGIKYNNRIDTTIPSKNGNPLDSAVIPSKGGFKFPGLVFENSLAGLIVKIPAKQAYAVNPTVRDLFTILQGLFDVK